jgi:hypothetical protein
VKTTGDPFIGAHIVGGSEPILSVVIPEVVEVAVPGKETGTGTLHVLPLAVVTVTPVIVLPFEEYL